VGVRGAGRWANLRVVTGDYLAFTQVDALWQLLGWSQPDESNSADGTPRPGKLRVRVVQTTQADGAVRAFHPKAWLFDSSSTGAAFVGSSNLTRSALANGIEWNLRVERSIDPLAYACVSAAVDALWATAADLTAPWIEDYARRVRQAPQPLPPGEADAEPLEPPPAPHEFQQEALAALARAREQGRRRALVVLATGLGKTWLAAHDVAQVARESGRFPRVLFLAHRHELLAQAEATFRRLLSAAGQPSHVGWCAGDLLEPEPLVVVASVQKLARPEHLQRILAAPPDYVIVDEVHHADAPTYRRVLDALDPAFLLGLTATPDRADDGDVLSLFDDFIAYRADQYLVPQVRAGFAAPRCAVRGASNPARWGTLHSVLPLH
jgi:HKD family nuclease